MKYFLPQEFRRVWSDWKIPFVVLLSLVLQTVLTATAWRRKFCTKLRLRFATWMVYLLAEWVALLSISLISNSRDNTVLADPTYIARSLWAPFLLLHLGGPDTITAYSMEDNETWKRSYVVLCGQVIVTVYVIFSAWSSDNLNYLAIPVLFAGSVKFAERVRAMMRASRDHFRKSMFSPPDPGPNYARFMEEYSSKRSEGFKVIPTNIIEAPTVGFHPRAVPANKFFPDAASLLHADSFFKSLKCLFADLVLTVHDVVNSQSFFQNRSCDEAFRVIEIELGFMFDVLYTKAVLVYTSQGWIRRAFTFGCVVFVFVYFSFIDKRAYSGKDIVVTYALMGGAVVLEIYAIGLLLRSDWAVLWLSRRNSETVLRLYQKIFFKGANRKRRWCNQIAQHSLIMFCLEDKSTETKIFEFFTTNYSYKCRSIPAELKDLIFQQLREKSKNCKDLTACKKLCKERGETVLTTESCYESLGWSIEDEFDHSVLLWHVATDLLYFTDPEENSNDPRREMSKMLSDYMLYILTFRPFMLPDGIGQIRYQDTCAEAKVFFEERRYTEAAKQAACRALKKVSTEILPSEVKGDRCKSVLFDACRLTRSVQLLEGERKWEKEKKWDLMSQLWVEMLCYVASQCQRLQHAQQLWQGGELLTHVWLLMAHLGITEQFQVSAGHARIKLTVE